MPHPHPRRRAHAARQVRFRPDRSADHTACHERLSERTVAHGHGRHDDGPRTGSVHVGRIVEPARIGPGGARRAAAAAARRRLAMRELV